MEQKEYSLRSHYELQSLEASDALSVREAPGALKFFAVVALILIAAAMIDKGLMAVQDWF